MKPKLGLVLTSGGARGAYQAGALLGMADLFEQKECPFTVLSGVSAGALNCAFLGANLTDFRKGVQVLTDTWSRLKPSDVYATDGLTLARIGVRWITDLSLGGFLGVGRGRSLLVTRPLRRLLTNSIDIKATQGYLADGRLHGFACTATNYYSGTAVTFFDGHPSIQPWVRATRVGIREAPTIDHLMASGSIPVFFPAVRLNGAYYGDGSIRLETPLSPAIHMQADRILAIAVRSVKSGDEVTKSIQERRTPHYPHLAEIGGVLFDSMFLDALETDVERTQRTNELIAALPEEARNAHPARYRDIPVMMLRPSKDVGALVVEVLERFPFTVRHLLRGLGAADETGWDMLSYLAFDAAYTSRLIELGYRDTLAVGKELSEFLQLKLRHGI